jgi:hypothetical protein
MQSLNAYAFQAMYNTHPASTRQFKMLSNSMVEAKSGVKYDHVAA